MDCCCPGTQVDQDYQNQRNRAMYLQSNNGWNNTKDQSYVVGYKSTSNLPTIQKQRSLEYFPSLNTPRQMQYKISLAKKRNQELYKANHTRKIVVFENSHNLRVRAQQLARRYTIKNNYLQNLVVDINRQFK